MRNLEGNPRLTDDVGIINVRQSIHQLKAKLDSTTQEEDLDDLDRKQWTLRRLKRKFKSEELRNLFELYTQRVNQTFFALLMIVQIVFFTGHLVIEVVVLDDFSSNLLDFTLYSFMSLLSVIVFFVADGCGYINFKNSSLEKLSIVFYLLLHFVNSVVPVYYFLEFSNAQLRPAYTTLIIISCYVFFHFSSIILTIFLGFSTVLIHIFLLIFITYHGLPRDELVKRLLSDIIYLLCINALGFYYRYLNEVMKRRSFLDRRACVIFNRHLQFQKMQEEQLMATIIPSYVIDSIRDDIMKCWNQLENPILESPLTDAFIYKAAFTQTFENVTILYADVVNYTEMTVKLHIKDLLETLNELFGSFDEQSEKLKVLRIKFLGDCYYCVAGLPPDPPENHAEACVDLGLDMIRIIGEVRRRRNININMRIGIHTGRIISGIIGCQKIHFDIWSKDVSLANQMETEGQPGKVHITQQTKNLLKKSYNIEPTEKFLKNTTIKTYLISTENQKTSLEKKLENIYVKKRGSNYSNSRSSNSGASSKTSTILSNADDSGDKNQEQNKVKVVQYYRLLDTGLLDEEKSTTNSPVSSRKTTETKESMTRDSQRRTAFVSSNIKRYHETMKETDQEMKESIESLNLTKYQQWFKFKEINPISLFFSSWKKEKQFLQRDDPLFKYYLSSVTFFIIFLYILQNLTLSQWNWRPYMIFATLGVIIFIFLPLLWMHHLFRNTSNKFLKRFCGVSICITKSIWARLSIYTVVCVMFISCVFWDIISCRLDYSSREHTGQRHHYGLCIVPWHMSQTCILAIIMGFLFLRMIIWVKFAYALITTILYGVFIWDFTDDVLITHLETYNYQLNPKISLIMGVIIVTLALHIIDRQAEYMNRLDFLWSVSLKEEQSKIQSRYIINKMLLNNVLPEHLTEMYLDMTRPPAALYHESYLNAAVMFASIVGMKMEEVQDENVFLNIMSNIIRDFDKLLLKGDMGRSIEKIKVAKWTYMAASGISPGTGAVNEDDPGVHIENLLIFATAMMKVLKQLNRFFSKDFKLRIGISHGPIAAGVVGSKKPLYDIWGDPVNMAARMDTTGEPNKIHVLEQTADILKQKGINCTFKGNTYVKGLKVPVPTYYVDVDNDFNLSKQL